jgi:hypothetical protein
MQAHLDQLELVLAAQVAGMTALKNWMPRKIELIRGSRLRELEAFNLREEEQVSRLQQAESQRQVLMSLIAHELGLPEGPGAPLQALLPHVGPDAAERLAEKREQLRALTAQLAEGQTLAGEMLRVNLELVHHTMDVFAQLATAAPPTGYGHGGDLHARPTASWLVDRQA